MKIENTVTRLLQIEYPLFMAPMFLVSNENMIKAAIHSGIMGVFPTLNFREKGELEQVLNRIKAYKNQHPEEKGNYGVNLIVQQTSTKFEEHLKICVKQKVPFYITSLGKPDKVIEEAHSYGGKVFCDVTNIEHAEKCAKLGCDGFIAVGQGAGGHAGPYPLHILIPALKNHFPEIPIIAAGGIATGSSILSMLCLGAEGASLGTRFIASTEASVNDEYKKAIVNYGMKDIVLSSRLSGTPSSVIRTKDAEKLGYFKTGFLENLFNKNKTTKKYYRMLLQLKSMKIMKESTEKGAYKKIWSAGQSVELIDSISNIDDIVKKLIHDMEESYEVLKKAVHP